MIHDIRIDKINNYFVAGCKNCDKILHFFTKDEMICYVKTDTR